MKKIFLLGILLLNFCKISLNNDFIALSDFMFLYKNPRLNIISKTSFPYDFIYPNSKLRYFMYLERTGIWTPDQYVLMLEIENSPLEQVSKFYKNILKIKDWQILQSKYIREKDKIVEFLNAQDFFNRNISIIIEEQNNKLQVKIYIKKLTDE